MDDFELTKHKEQFEQATGTEDDPTMLVIRTHLFSESLLERLITFYLPCGYKIIEGGNLSFHQKLSLVASFDYLPDSIVSTLKNLNKLRNECAHELNKKITATDVTRLGSPLGKRFTQIKREAKYEEKVVLRNIIAFICGILTGHCHKLENSHLVPQNDKPQA